jgi:hypothetical protein
VEFEADIDSIACTIGDVIRFQNDVPQWGVGGRIVSATPSSAELDKTVTVGPSGTYQLLVRSSEDAISTNIVTNSPGETNNITISGTFATTPVKYDLWAFGQTNYATKNFRIIGISRKGDLTATINAVEYYPEMYIDNCPIIPAYQASVQYPYPVLKNLVLYQTQNPTEISASWELVQNTPYHHAEVWFKPTSSGTWAYHGDTPTMSDLIIGVTTGSWDVKVIGVSPVGVKNPTPLIGTITLEIVSIAGNPVGPNTTWEGYCITFGQASTWFSFNDWDHNGAYSSAGHDLEYLYDFEGIGTPPVTGWTSEIDNIKHVYDQDGYTPGDPLNPFRYAKVRVRCADHSWKLAPASLGGIAGITISTPGSAYMVDDYLVPIQGNNDTAMLKVLSVSPSGTGGVDSISIDNSGYGYSLASSLTTSAAYGVGIGCTVNITALAAGSGTIWSSGRKIIVEPMNFVTVDPAHVLTSPRMMCIDSGSVYVSTGPSANPAPTVGRFSSSTGEFIEWYQPTVIKYPTYAPYGIAMTTSGMLI